MMRYITDWIRTYLTFLSRNKLNFESNICDAKCVMLLKTLSYLLFLLENIIINFFIGINFVQYLTNFILRNILVFVQ